MKNESIFSFIAGIMVGIVLGLFIGDEEKRRIQQTFNRQADKLRKDYEGPVKDGVDRVKKFVKEHLA